MRDNGFISREQCAAARAEKIAVGSRQNAQGQTYAVDYIRQQVIAAVGWDRAINEGYRIHTTIDVNLQRAAEDSLKAHLEQAEQHPEYNHHTYADYAASFRKAKASGKMAEQPAPEYLQGAAIGLDNATGDILVLVGGRDFEHNQFNRALQARRPAGTAMLPFVYATAFERGMYPGSVVEDSPLDNRAVMIGGTTGILGEWGPEDADNHYEGRMTARQALVKSKNGATVRIGMDAGIEAVLQLCSSAGIRSPLRPYPATFLGSSEITLAELAMGYTIFPNGEAENECPPRNKAATPPRFPHPSRCGPLRHSSTSRAPAWRSFDLRSGCRHPRVPIPREFRLCPRSSPRDYPEANLQLPNPDTVPFESRRVNKRQYCHARRAASLQRSKLVVLEIASTYCARMASRLSRPMAAPCSIRAGVTRHFTARLWLYETMLRNRRRCDDCNPDVVSACSKCAFRESSAARWRLTSIVV